MHRPSAQLNPSSQTLPQTPQFSLSVRRLFGSHSPRPDGPHAATARQRASTRYSPRFIQRLPGRIGVSRYVRRSRGWIQLPRTPDRRESSDPTRAARRRPAGTRRRGSSARARTRTAGSTTPPRGRRGRPAAGERRSTSFLNSLRLAARAATAVVASSRPSVRRHADVSRAPADRAGRAPARSRRPRRREGPSKSGTSNSG